MPVSKKMKVCANSKPKPSIRNCDQELIRNFLQIQRDHKKQEAAGTRAPVKANGLPVKAPKPTSIVRRTIIPTTSRVVRGLRIWQLVHEKNKPCIARQLIVLVPQISAQTVGKKSSTRI
jgi:hypothetical protein